MNVTFIWMPIVMVFCAFNSNAQENRGYDPAADSLEMIHAAQVYIQKQARQYKQYEKKAARSQHKLLQQLKRQEQRLARQLQKSDSALYTRYQKLNSLSFDSLYKSSKDSGFVQQISSKYPSKALDSLKKIQSFIQSKAGLLGTESPVAIPGLDQLNQKLSIQNFIQSQLKQRSADLSRLLGNSALAGKAARLKQTLAYGQQQVGYWKQIINDPDEAEEKALDYLKGIEGFNEYLDKANGANNPMSAAMSNPNVSAADLEAMGYQTKASVSAGLQQQFGSQLDQLQQQAGQQMQQFSQQLGIDKQLNQAKQAANTLKENKALLKESQSSLKQAKQQLKEKQGGNPVRGIPFWHRWELQYNFQSQRASADGLKPVIVQAGVNAAYRQSKNLNLGIGLDGSLGLGKDWQHLRLSYEGIVGRVFIDNKIIYGFSLQGGYEKSLRPNNRPYVQLQEQYGNNSNLKTEMGLLQDAAYLGIMKRYKINSKAQGTFLIGYNFLADKTGINSPWIIRLGWKM